MRMPTALKTIILALILALPASASAQYTLAPPLIPSWLDNSGLVADGFGFCTYVAGTTTLATTYVSATGTANSNPILFDSAGRASVSGSNPETGIWLSPGNSYKFVYVDFTATVGTPSCVGAPNGSVVWTIDNVSAVPASAVNEDVAGVVGESFALGELGYLSDGSGSKTAGLWYKTDADLNYAGALPLTGFAVAAITSGNSGLFRMGGQLTGLTGLVVGADYYISTTAGAITATAPLQARWVGRAQSATILNVQTNPRKTAIKPLAPCGRLTASNGVPVPITNVTAATTLYYAPFGGCTSISFYDGTALWYQSDFQQISIAVPATTATMYDVFVYDNAGTPTLELTAWTNDTTRATALTTQNGVYVKTGATTRLYLGSVRTTAVAGQLEDSLTYRGVYNYYHRVARPWQKFESTATWTYTLAAFRQARATATNQVQCVIGVVEDPIHLVVQAFAENGASAVHIAVAVGEDSTTTPAAGQLGMGSQINNVGAGIAVQATLDKHPSSVGFHTYVWLESSEAAGGTDWKSGNNAPYFAQSGLSGWVMQ